MSSAHQQRTSAVCSTSLAARRHTCFRTASRPMLQQRLRCPTSSKVRARHRLGCRAASPERVGAETEEGAEQVHASPVACSLEVPCGFPLCITVTWHMQASSRTLVGEDAAYFDVQQQSTPRWAFFTAELAVVLGIMYVVSDRPTLARSLVWQAATLVANMVVSMRSQQCPCAGLDCARHGAGKRLPGAAGKGVAGLHRHHDGHLRRLRPGAQRHGLP